MVTSTFLSSNSKHNFCYTMANIFPSHIQQCLNLAMHFSLRHLAAKMLSPLHNNFISFPYFFPSYETCSINVNALFHAAIKNLHIKANDIFVFFILLYFTTLSEGITHRRKNISSLKMVTNIPIAKHFSRYTCVLCYCVDKCRCCLFSALYYSLSYRHLIQQNGSLVQNFGQN